jgi:hypothetical protein
LSYDTEACKSCQAPMLWAITTNGKHIPVDAEPVAVNGGGGNIRLTPRPGMAPLAKVVRNPADLFGVREVYRSHFATCPHADRHRQRGRR